MCCAVPSARKTVCGQSSILLAYVETSKPRDTTTSYNVCMKASEYWETVKKEKRTKHRNVKTVSGGKTYDSKKEADHAQTLQTLTLATLPEDRVVSFEEQVPYRIEINGMLICKYYADFVVTFADGRIEVQDVKSKHTRKLPVYRLKKKLMKAVHGIDIVEV